MRPDGRISFRLKPLQELGPQANSLDEAVFAGSPLLAVHQQALRGPVARLTPALRLRNAGAPTLFYLHPVVDGPRVLGTLVLQGLTLRPLLLLLRIPPDNMIELIWKDVKGIVHFDNTFYVTDKTKVLRISADGKVTTGVVELQQGNCYDAVKTLRTALSMSAEMKPKNIPKAWFSLGDRDLATHLYRSERLARGATKSEVDCRVRGSRRTGDPR